MEDRLLPPREGGKGLQGQGGLEGQEVPEFFGREALLEEGEELELVLHLGEGLGKGGEEEP